MLDLASGRLCLLKGMVSGRVEGESYKQETVGRVLGAVWVLSKR